MRPWPVFVLFYYLYWRAPQQMLRTHLSLEGLLCNPMRNMMRFFFCFSNLMGHRWNESDRGKPKYSEEDLSQCHFVHHKSHMDRLAIEPGPPRWVLWALRPHFFRPILVAVFSLYLCFRLKCSTKEVKVSDDKLKFILYNDLWSAVLWTKFFI